MLLPIGPGKKVGAGWSVRQAPQPRRCSLCSEKGNCRCLRSWPGQSGACSHAGHLILDTLLAET